VSVREESIESIRMTAAVAQPAAADPDAVDGTEDAEPVPADRDRPRWYRRVPLDLWVAVAYVLGGLWITLHLWVELKSRVLNSFPPDQYLFEFWLSHSARVFTHGENPFFTSQLNYPMGVNVMANTAMFGMTLPLVPVTLLFGPHVSFAVMVTTAPALTALGWYFLFSRRLVRSRLAAALAGAFCGFAPGIIAQDNVHPNLAMQLPVPLIVWQVLRLRDRHVAPWKPGLLLGLLIVYQFFINEEILLITAIGCLVFVVAWALYNRAEAKSHFWRLVAGLAVAAAVAFPLLAYPMWYQFFGPQHYRGFGAFASLFGADLASFTAFPTHSLASGPDSVRIANNVVEETTFFGWPLVVMIFVWAATLWRRTEVRAAMIAAAMFGIASLGSHLHVAGKVRHIPAPWALVSHVPLLDSVIPSRLTLAMLPFIGMLIALTVDNLRALPRDRIGRGLRLVGWAGVTMALVPVIPTPFSVVSRAPIPAFVTAGTWRSYVTPGHTMVLVPIPTGATGIAAVQWTAAALGDIPIAGGYFVGPNPQTPDSEGMFGPPPRPTLTIFYRISLTGNAPPPITAEDRNNAVDDLKFWHAAVVVLHPAQRHAELMRKTMTDLIGFSPRFVSGVWLWDVRALTA
jgi:hypothetical protein